MQKKYAIIGHPLKHSLSPCIHSEIAKQYGLDLSYELMEILPEQLEASMDELKALDGFSVTIPYKINIIKYLDHLDEMAQLYMSVNTVHCVDGKMFGYNTDCIGLTKAFELYNAELCGKVLILGAGGVSRTFAFEAAKHGCDITFAVRKSGIGKAKDICSELHRKISLDIKTEICSIADIKGSFDVLLNGTPVGMYPNIDACPVSDDVISCCKVVFDAVYNPDRTQLIKKAEALGFKAVKGLPMLIYQAIAQQEIWQGRHIDIDYDSLAKAVSK